LDSPDEDDLLFTPFENKKATEREPPSFPQTVSKEPPMDRRQLEKTSGPTKLGNSFLDSPDEDDSLFSPVKTVAAPVARNAAAATAKSKEISAKVAPAFPKLPDTAKAQVKTKLQAPPKLFDDSDDDDDLFASAAVPASVASVPATNRTKQHTKPAVTSLFSSDDEEPEVSAKIAPVKKLPVKTSKSLFSDEDDDDDLFGGGSTSKGSTSKKSKPLAKAASKAPTSKAATPTTIIPSKSSDNPLADLLDFE